MTHEEKLRDPRWQKKRLEVLSAAKFKCEDCGDPEHELHVHHCYDIPGREPWQYDHNLLMCLCGACQKHRQAREISLHVKIGEIIRFISPGELECEVWRLTEEIAGKQRAKYEEAFAA